MRSRALVLAAFTTAAAGCGVLPWAEYGPAPEACAALFDPAAGLEWAGRGHLVELGLVPADNAPVPAHGDIYVGDAGDERWWCLVTEGGRHDATVDVVPEGWQPP